MNKERTPFPTVFWIANTIEILERFAYYGIYLGFPIYFAALGYKTAQLGIIQAFFLLLSYVVPVISGTFADKFGFRKVLLISYLAYLPSILLLIFTKTFSGVAMSMICIGFAAGIFKPLVSGTVRVTTDSSNRTIGFGIFYAMVNIGGTFGPLILGWLRAISWQNAYIAAATAIGLMFIVTFLFYREPVKPVESVSLGRKLREIGTTLADVRFTIFLILLGLFFWLPFWSFFNLCSKYVESGLNGAELYKDIKMVAGSAVANFLSSDHEGERRVLGETISQTGWVIMLFQVPVAWLFERFRPIPSFISGLLILGAGFGLLALAGFSNPAWVFPGILLFAVGEMISSPRIQEYIAWIAPKDKAGLYMGSNFLAIGLGGFLSGIIYTSRIYSHFENTGNPEYVWLILGVHILTGVVVMLLFSRFAGQFKQQES